MIAQNVIEAKKLFYSKKYKTAYEVFLKENCLYEAGLCELLLKDTKKARFLWTKVKKVNPAANFGLCVLDFIELKTKNIPTFFQTRAQLEIYLNLFIENNLIEWAQNLISCCDYLKKANPESYKFIARALFANGYFDLAITFCKKSMKIFYCDPEAMLILAQCYFLLGDLGESLDITNKINRMVENYYPSILFKDILLTEIKNKNTKK